MSDLDSQLRVSIIAPTPTTPVFHRPSEYHSTLKGALPNAGLGNQADTPSFDIPHCGGSENLLVTYSTNTAGSTYSSSRSRSRSTYSSAVVTPPQRSSTLTRRSPVLQQSEHQLPPRQVSPHRFWDKMEKGDYPTRLEDQVVLDSPEVSPMITAPSKFTSPPPTPDLSLTTSSTSGLKKSKSSPVAMARAVLSRSVRSARRANLPFMVVFVTCVLVFFSALAGIGYTETILETTKTATAEFSPGTPVFDDKEAHVAMLENQRKLEEQWAAKLRPQDGAWIHRRRDDKAVRRKVPDLIKKQGELQPGTEGSEAVGRSPEQGKEVIPASNENP